MAHNQNVFAHLPTLAMAALRKSAENKEEMCTAEPNLSFKNVRKKGINVGLHLFIWTDNS